MYLRHGGPVASPLRPAGVHGALGKIRGHEAALGPSRRLRHGRAAVVERVPSRPPLAHRPPLVATPRKPAAHGRCSQCSPQTQASQSSDKDVDLSDEGGCGRMGSCSHLKCVYGALHSFE
eukprot:CAMPEP_0174289966 /NCGR_PEP_ID=MMETSP0809-20121228/27029_1 /TAXON_ID=73025 ORGANISM="Eutreptiella gymnastica-like, Strain CCMP1594" /NCGR_SAMPLE_ID=MMETSP0809 /ASSEMBLY_ACC=CAM_ASM_000658 /LENGTH=119 /DNA_ID=CAMNT_0015388283 /DNA_START=81 /DNA_END=440 /DNA_ORIENTATION=-